MRSCVAKVGQVLWRKEGKITLHAFVRYVKCICCVPVRWADVDARLRVRLRVRNRLRELLRGRGAPFALGTLEKQLAEET